MSVEAPLHATRWAVKSPRDQSWRDGTRAAKITNTKRGLPNSSQFLLTAVSTNGGNAKGPTDLQQMAGRLQMSQQDRYSGPNRRPRSNSRNTGGADKCVASMEYGTLHQDPRQPGNSYRHHGGGNSLRQGITSQHEQGDVPQI